MNMTGILQGDCREVLKTLEGESVDCCVTSPPYFGLRDYGVSGQIGLEQKPDEYVTQLVAVFREVRRVLANDGTLWLNLGDSYARGPGKGGSGPGGKNVAYSDNYTDDVRRRSESKGSSDGKVGRGDRAAVRVGGNGLKAKDLIGIPWRVAFALQADGWYLRQDIIWHKPNPMPESVTDRCTKSHEYMFLLSKSERYYFDNEAIKEPTSDNPVSSARRNRADFSTVGTKAIQGTVFGQSGKGSNAEHKGETRNKRDVWTIATKPYKGAHFATFPPELIRPCIRAGCPKGGLVLDPFGGSGTTAQVANEEGRDAIMIELNPEYVPLINKRIGL